MRPFTDLQGNNQYTLANFFGPFAVENATDFLKFIDQNSEFYVSYNFDDAKKSLAEIAELCDNTLYNLDFCESETEPGVYLDGLNFFVQGGLNGLFNVKTHLIARIEFTKPKRSPTTRVLISLKELNDRYQKTFKQDIREVLSLT